MKRIALFTFVLLMAAGLYAQTVKPTRPAPNLDMASYLADAPMPVSPDQRRRFAEPWDAWRERIAADRDSAFKN